VWRGARRVREPTFQFYSKIESREKSPRGGAPSDGFFIGVFNFVIKLNTGAPLLQRYLPHLQH
jgi:hypothetical protein